MRIEIAAQKPDHFKQNWDGQYAAFSHFEFACGIPSVMYLITTVKENGKPNVCLSAWSSFTGGADGYFAVIGGLSKHGHTYRSIQRTGEFILNFISNDYYDHCIDTIRHNSLDEDEIRSGGFTAEGAKTVACPRIAEAFLCMECRLDQQVDLSASTQLLVGRTQHIAMQPDFAGAIDGKYDRHGFMFNIHEPVNLVTGEGKQSAVAVCKIARIIEEG